jgi:cytochrome c5
MDRIPAALVVLGVSLALVACGKQKVDEEKTAELIQPVARVQLAEAAVFAPAGAPKSGEEIVKTVCTACHGPAGIPQSPKIGDKAAWAPRIAQGMDVLYTSALNGKNGIMPARGGNPNLSDGEIKAAVDYLVKQAK